MGTDQQYLIFREYVRGIEHDVLLIAVSVTNIRRITARYRVHIDESGNAVCYAKPYFARKNGSLTLHGVPPAREPIPLAQFEAKQQSLINCGGRFPFLRQVAAGCGLKELAQKLTRYQPVPEYEQPDNPAWLLMRAILEEWIRNASKPVVVMPLPLPQYVEETADATAYLSRLRELAEANSVTLHDPLPDLLKKPERERRLFRFRKDIHPTPEGHAALAASLKPVLERLLTRAG